ncbi:hypothetical protein DFH11DRAFT_1851021 [Phellopilus nigrolimitatus]|nr:hypothetical protein DFH11DRAFT_1851021 [Phellopilus nigrolimitatus]
MLAALRSTVKRLLRSKRTSAKNEPNKSREEQDERQTKRIKTQHIGRAEETHARLAVTKPLGNQKRLAGRLAMKVLMLDDIFFEIAHYLGPDDLLRMSRSSKAIRGLLMSKNSKPIWRAAEKAVELPKCPSDLSSPQYASFVFDKYCTVRLKDIKDT